MDVDKTGFYLKEFVEIYNRYIKGHVINVVKMFVNFIGL